MHKASVYFFCSCFIVLVGLFSFWTIDFATQSYISIGLIFLLGIPHGAIDHLLITEEDRGSSLRFYVFYIGLILLYFTGWLLLPQWSMVLFLLLSAFHFGQSQFSELKVPSRWLSYSLNFFWGCSILSGLIFYNSEEIIQLVSSSPDISVLGILFQATVFKIILWLTSFLTIVIWSLLYYYQEKINKLDEGKISKSRWYAELITLLLIHACFYLLPVVIGFTVYFISLHSLKVLSEEFSFFKVKKAQYSLVNFLLLLLPYTLISVIGALALMYLASIGIFNVSNILLVLILLSVLTLPHSLVMNRFYQKLYGKIS